MDNIEKVLENFFRRVSPDKIIEQRLCGDAVSEKDFVQLMLNYSEGYSDTELENMFNYLSDKFYLKYYGSEQISAIQGRLDIFSLLKCYSAWILTFQGNEVVCEYWKLFHWRKITDALSEDLLVASFLVDWESRMTGKRIRRFDWKPFLTHNNEDLRKIVKKGMCDNHYHLKGSAPIFHLTWISLMNDVVSEVFAENLKRLEMNRRNTNKQYESDYKEMNFQIQVGRAALIRLFLVSVLLNKRIIIGNYSNCFGKENGFEYNQHWKRHTEKNVRYLLENPIELTAFFGEIQSQITMLKMLTREDMFYPDYALYGINDIIDEKQKGLAYQGERWFLYEMLKGINSRSESLAQYRDMFYAYLVIKENIRAEIVQIKKYVGFENFKIYQDRKDLFIEGTFMNNLLVKEAVQSSLLDSNVVALEARIAPRSTYKSMRNYIKKMDSIICGDDEERKSRIFYTVHFIKTGKDKYKEDIPVRCRYYELRQRVQQQAQVLAYIREKYPDEGKRVRGIDSANVEIGCGPEVFAQAFRFLRAHLADQNGKVPQLHMTYHVGEDFLDLISGLRAIDEAIHFLNLGCGSRLGHVLALGIDPDQWYRKKTERIILPQQEYLDNVVWLYQMLRILRIPTSSVLLDYLERQFHYYFSIIYQGAIEEELLDHIKYKAQEYYKGLGWGALYRGKFDAFNMDSYYCAWEIRGDNPYHYRNGFYENKYADLNPGNRYSSYAVNYNFPRKQEERYFPETGFLYYLYHFSDKVRKEGQKCIEIKVKSFWKQAVWQIQKEMQKRIAQSGIAIETNPTSNYKISTFDRYADHPIIRFYNMHLVDDPKLLEECVQLNVSINTDDQGVFNTSLENEYAYMALALEKEKDNMGKPVYKKNMIYKWIDDIRKMGIRQSFLTEREIKKLFSQSQY